MNTGCDIATPEQMMADKKLHWVRKEGNVLVEGASTQLPRLCQNHNVIFSVPV